MNVYLEYRIESMFVLRKNKTMLRTSKTNDVYLWFFWQNRNLSLSNIHRHWLVNFRARRNLIEFYWQFVCLLLSNLDREYPNSEDIRMLKQFVQHRISHVVHLKSRQQTVDLLIHWIVLLFYFTWIGQLYVND